MAVEKVAIITAGGSGMGAAAAKRLAADGFRIAVLSSSGKGEALAAETGCTVHALPRRVSVRFQPASMRSKPSPRGGSERRRLWRGMPQV